MSRPIIPIIIMMTLCVILIIGMQFFWNYQNYRTTVKNFDHDVNEALKQAADSEVNIRLNNIVDRCKSWLNDSSVVTISCNYKNRDSNTVFYVRDAHPKFKKDNSRAFSFGINDITQKLTKVTPEVKKLFIDHFATIVKHDMQQGYVYYYTQALGDSLKNQVDISHLNLKVLSECYKTELSNHEISTNFELNPSKGKNDYLTKKITAGLLSPFKKERVIAAFISPDIFFFNKMKWILALTLLLFLITISCFGYTLKTILTEDKVKKLKDDFVNNMTHELNTPISSIKITAEALKTFSHDEITQHKYYDIISLQADKLKNMTDQILERSSLVLKQKETMIIIDLEDIISQAIGEMQPLVINSAASIKFVSEGQKLKVSGYADSLKHAIMNLIDNSLKYIDKEAHILIELHTSLSFAVLIISDNGIGIPAEYKQYIFDKFYRIPSGNIHNIKGYGLGLSLVKQVIKEHGGSIAVTENLPKGTTIIIKLPLIYE